MGIVGKKLSILRFLGWFIILGGLIYTLIVDFFYLSHPFYILGLILVISLTLIILKLPYDLIEDNRLLLGIISLIFIIIFNAVILIFTVDQDYFLRYLTVIISDFALFITLHFTLSIKQKEKIIFIIAFVIYLILSITFKLDFLIGQINIGNSIPIIISTMGFFCNFIAETSMRKKGLMKYI